MMTTILYGLFLGFWRRWFGGGLDRLPDNRFVQHIIGFTACFLVLWYKGSGWVLSLICAVVLQGLYWAPSHGPAFDLSRGGQPDEKMIERYKKVFWNKWCEFLVPKSSWYGFGYDFLWLMFRYELPALLISALIFNLTFAFAGYTTAIIYAVCWALFDKNKLKHLSGTELAEYISGFLTGVLLTL